MMDPNACLARLLDACGDGESDTARDCLHNLLDWLSRGGALPQDPRLLAANIAASRDPGLTNGERSLISHALMRLLWDTMKSKGVMPKLAEDIIALGTKITAGMTQ